LIAKDFLKSRDFLRKDKYFAPKQRTWFPSSYYPSTLYPSSYSSSSLNEISLSQEDDEAFTEERAIFTYDERDIYGPHNWGLINKNCDGDSQSPVNLYESSAKAVDIREPLIFDGLNDMPASITAFNNGHAVGMRFNFTYGPIRVLGGPLNVPYILDNVHWHWGRDDREGSEHVLNSRRYSAEVHFVLYNSIYGKIKTSEWTVFRD
jgi:carbonic anhydrase